jgi:DNA-binding transcriptional regulator YhcF (GntR family)
MLNIEEQFALPKHIEIERDILQKLLSETYQAGDKLPTVSELIKTYNSCSATIQRVIKNIERKGIIECRRGSGIYLKDISSLLPEKQIKKELSQLYIIPNLIDISTNTHSVNSFILNEIQKGIINNFSGNINILSGNEFISKKLRQQYIISLNAAPPFIDHLHATETCYINIDLDNQFPLQDNIIKVDHMSGIYDMISHMVNHLGHRRIGLIAGSSKHHADRIAAYKIALQTHHLELDETLIKLVAGGAKHYGYSAMTDLLSLKHPPTAVFVDTDIKAAGAIEAASEAGIKIPEDISICGFDDIPGAEKLRPPLTTVKLPYYQLGETAVAMIKQRFSSRHNISGKLIKTELVLRESMTTA